MDIKKARFLAEQIHTEFRKLKIKVFVDRDNTELSNGYISAGINLHPGVHNLTLDDELPDDFFRGLPVSSGNIDMTDITELYRRLICPILDQCDMHLSQMSASYTLESSDVAVFTKQIASNYATVEAVLNRMKMRIGVQCRHYDTCSREAHPLRVILSDAVADQIKQLFEKTFAPGKINFGEFLGSGG